jgi:23S rRNA (pseudouridine1915-N3)-methyltransferase
MRYHLVAIGQLRRGFAQDGCRFYESRLSQYAKVTVTEAREGRGDPATVREKESAALLAAATGYVVALDERGVRHTSQGLAEELTRLELASVSQLSLLIGGAEGHSDALRARADALWSLSPLTLPHELARLILLEQLYRAETIRAGHPYHRG